MEQASQLTEADTRAILEGGRRDVNFSVFDNPSDALSRPTNTPLRVYKITVEEANAEGFNIVQQGSYEHHDVLRLSSAEQNALKPLSREERVEVIQGKLARLRFEEYTGPIFGASDEGTGSNPESDTATGGGGSTEGEEFLVTPAEAPKED